MNHPPETEQTDKQYGRNQRYHPEMHPQQAAGNIIGTYQRNQCKGEKKRLKPSDHQRKGTDHRPFGRLVLKEYFEDAQRRQAQIGSRQYTP